MPFRPKDGAFKNIMLSFFLFCFSVYLCVMFLRNDVFITQSYTEKQKSKRALLAGRIGES